MARSISTIQNQIISAIQNDSVLSNLNSVSSTSIWNLWTYIIATSQAIEEQLNDNLINDVESILNTLPPGTAPWIQRKAFEFQYSDVTPQIIQFNTTTFAPYYLITTPNLQIITNCSISEISNSFLIIKVAKGGDNPIALTTNELNAFQSYFNLIKPCGITYKCISLNADRLFSEFTITYQGIYSAVINTNLLNAFQSYLKSIPFGGVIKLVDILISLRQVVGVVDVVCNNMIARGNSLPFGTGTNMVTDNTVIEPEYTTDAGYIIIEDTSGQDFISQLNLISI